MGRVGIAPGAASTGEDEARAVVIDRGVEVSTTTTNDAGTFAINTMRAPCMDAIQRANSGHPGTPMLEERHVD